MKYDWVVKRNLSNKIVRSWKMKKPRPTRGMGGGGQREDGRSLSFVGDHCPACQGWKALSGDRKRRALNARVIDDLSKSSFKRRRAALHRLQRLLDSQKRGRHVLLSPRIINTSASVLTNLSNAFLFARFGALKSRSSLFKRRINFYKIAIAMMIGGSSRLKWNSTFD